MLSGSMVYPHTQFLNSILIAYCLSLLPSISQPILGIHKQFTIKMLVMCLAIVLLYIQYPNFSLWDSSSEIENISKSYGPVLAPYFWQFGNTELLRKL